MHLILISFFCILLGIYIIHNVYLIKISYSSRKWLKFYGKVISRRIVREKSIGEAEYYFYRLKLEIEFTFKRKKFICNDIYCDKDEEFSTEIDAANFLEEAKIGSNVVIYINPKNPKQSAIFRSENPEKNLLSLFISLIILFISIYLYIHFISK